MIKVTASSDLEKIKHLPKNIQKSIQKILRENEQALKSIPKDRTVLVVEKLGDLDSIKALGLKENAVIPEFEKEIFGDEEQKYVVFFMALNDEQLLIYYIPVAYLEDSIV